MENENLYNFAEELDNLQVENFETTMEEEGEFYNYSDAFFGYTTLQAIKFIEDWEDENEKKDFLKRLENETIEVEYCVDGRTYEVTARFEKWGQL
jgi:hypothetical protein